MDLGGLGWRELVLLAAALAGFYLVFALIALRRLNRRSPAMPAVEPTAPRVPTHLSDPLPVAPERSWQHPFRTRVEFATDAPPVLTEVDMADDERPLPNGGAARTSTADSPFAATLAWTKLESELDQLRAEVAALRQELTEFQEARRISPLYADAAALAHRGFDARGVAEECGISVAEAELVLAMSRDDNDFDSEVENDADGRKHDTAE